MFHQRTEKVTNQHHSTSVALIGVKMASAMGVTWILGIAANLRVLSFLWYPYVVLNSLQGTSPFFIISNFTSVCNLPKVKKIVHDCICIFFLNNVEVEVRGACQCSCVFSCKCRDMALNNDQLLA